MPLYHLKEPSCQSKSDVTDKLERLKEIAIEHQNMKQQYELEIKNIKEKLASLPMITPEIEELKKKEEQLDKMLEPPKLVRQDHLVQSKPLKKKSKDIKLKDQNIVVQRWK